MVFDPDAARRGNPQTCDKCDVADAVCAAYRHALKDVARGEPADAKLTAMLALDDDSMYRLGQIFHKIVKAAVQMAHDGQPTESSYKALREAVEEIWKNPGATVKGWVSGKV